MTVGQVYSEHDVYRTLVSHLTSIQRHWNIIEYSGDVLIYFGPLMKSPWITQMRKNINLTLNAKMCPGLRGIGKTITIMNWKSVIKRRTQKKDKHERNSRREEELILLRLKVVFVVNITLAELM